jgi:hypothetical protein
VIDLFEHADHRPSDDALWDQTIQERDNYHEWADKLADGIATHFGIEIGEHSSANNPWDVALDTLACVPDAAPLPRVAATVPEGCTPADAKMLRAANHSLSAENGKLRQALAPFARVVSTDKLSWAMVEYCVQDDPEKQTFQRPQMQREFNRAASIYNGVVNAASPAADSQGDSNGL